MQTSSEITRGERVRLVSAGAFTVVDATYVAPRRWGVHAHDEALISFAASADYAETVDGTRFICRRGEYLIKSAGVPHSNRFDSARTRCVSIAVARSVTELSEAVQRMFASPRRLSSEAGSLQSMVLLELRRGDEFAPLALEGIIYELLAALGRNSNSVASDSFLRARDYIQAFVSDNPTIEEIARAAGVHPGHLNRLFRRHSGASTADYVRRVRVERAVRDLVETGLPLSEIAVKHGFYDQSHFTRSVLRYRGRSPGSYRRNANLSETDA
jgi:AraC family transcriptional regulator